jgi:hypothetical protein
MKDVQGMVTPIDGENKKRVVSVAIEMFFLYE